MEMVEIIVGILGLVGLAVAVLWFLAKEIRDEMHNNGHKNNQI